MKKTILIVVIILLGFTPEKKYPVTMTVQEWQKNINVIEYTKNILKASNAPANIVLPLCDSLTKFQTEIVTQLQSQLDTTKKK